VVLPATDYFIDLPPFDFLVKAFEFLLDEVFPVFFVFASSSAPAAYKSSSSSSKPAGSISINKSAANIN
jgi:hypothetical protein